MQYDSIGTQTNCLKGLPGSMFRTPSNTMVSMLMITHTMYFFLMVYVAAKQKNPSVPVLAMLEIGCLGVTLLAGGIHAGVNKYGDRVSTFMYNQKERLLNFFDRTTYVKVGDGVDDVSSASSSLTGREIARLHRESSSSAASFGSVV